MITQQAFYNSGELWAIGSDANATPAPFGTLQDVSLDFSFTEKALRGQSMFPEEVAQAEAKITGKAKFGRIDLALFNAQYFNGTLTTGRNSVSYNEAAAVPPATPWTVTVANAATFSQDLGVVYSANIRQRLEKVAAAPALGQYSVSPAGVYTFAAADANAGVLISYSYTVAASGHTLAVTNQLAGSAPYFSIILNNTYQGNAFGCQLFRCMSSKLSLASKLGDFAIPEFDFTALADASGRVINFWGL